MQTLTVILVALRTLPGGFGLGAAAPTDAAPTVPADAHGGPVTVGLIASTGCDVLRERGSRMDVPPAVLPGGATIPVEGRDHAWFGADLGGDLRPARSGR